LKEVEKDFLSSGEITWYLDNQKAGTGAALAKDFSTYEEGKDHRILAVHKNEKGEYAYSRSITKNDLIKPVSFGQTAAVTQEQT
ncbi:hypothetical protein LH384_34155, partial [Pseudomonas aeruginosa]|nr:hypothetical protein [Pseudomonas aeruginosa]